MRSSSIVVSLPYEIDMTNAAEVGEELARAIAMSPKIVIADLSATTFCDSSGIRAMLVTAHQAADHGAELLLVVPENGAVQRIIGLMGLDRLLPVCPTLAAAVPEDPAPG